MRLIAGLGNPGNQYQETRHNVGFKVLDEFLKQSIIPESDNLQWKNKFFAKIINIQYKTEKIILMKPLTFMNLSGKSIAEVVNYYGIKSSQLLIIYDDIHLSLGRIRIRQKGSSGGHKGIQSIIDCLKTENFPRLRIGVKNDFLLKNIDQPSFVLSRFLPEEKFTLDKSVDLAIMAIRDILDFDYQYAMGQYNKTENNDDEKDV
ncbi:MAG: aminoacyl-tRNA hydrolase [Atribacterota bacterium]|nr:aminoacyl-tRNA hydrolase [Atribacterota bacterium]